VTPRTPVHVVLRVTEAVGRLRRRHAYHAIRLAILTAAVLGLIRVVHVSIQPAITPRSSARRARRVIASLTC